MVNNEQLTVVFHVDDLKASRKEQTVLDKFINQLKDIFGNQDKLSESTGLGTEKSGYNSSYCQKVIICKQTDLSRYCGSNSILMDKSTETVRRIMRN